jgi:glycine cleavage system H lipoate-binding protein
MACPFLKEGRAQYCLAAPARKLILEGPGVSGAGRCTSPEYYRCDLVTEKDLHADRCPHLEELHVQYCGATSPTKLIPFSESQLSSCTSGGYRYCDSYLSVARPHGVLTPPPNLLYSPNHFWLAVEDSGLCHIGIDAFLSEVVANVDGLTFVTTHGTQRPVIALNVHGVDWPMTFPNPLLIQKVNCYVRSDPKRVISDPYGSGWLFSGWELPGRTRAGLITGPPAVAWQEEEQERLAQEIHETPGLSCDGGRPMSGVGKLLSRQQLVCLFQHYFSNTHWGPKE